LLLHAGGIRRTEGLLVVALFVTWLTVTSALIGFETPIFLLGGLSFLSSIGMARKYGRRGVAAFGAVLLVLLGVGLL
jgi:hypothetical protein